MKRTVLRRVSSGLMVVGALLLVINVIGLFDYTRIDATNPHLLPDSPRTLTAQEFWHDAVRRDGESLKAYVVRLTALVNDRMLYIDARYTKPTFFQNYLLWTFSQHQGSFEWLNARKAVRQGGGLCSEHAIVMNSILRRQGIPTRILLLSGDDGHVLNEVRIGHQWLVFDPLTSIAFEQTLKALKSNPAEIYQAYRNVGQTAAEAAHWVRVYEGDNDRLFATAADYSRQFSPYYAVLEWACIYLIWILPAALIVCAMAIAIVLGESGFLGAAHVRIARRRRHGVRLGY